MQTEIDRERRHQLALRALEKKAEKDLSWTEIADAAGLSPVFVTAAVLGQHPLPPEAAKSVASALDLSASDESLLQRVPLRGTDVDVKSDPTIYRFHEMMTVYGPALKMLVHEMFGDGIISAINFKIGIDRVDDPDGGHRAVITLDGKYLPGKPF